MELFTAIKDALITRLQRLPWMDEETRKEAQDRVRPLKGKGQYGNMLGVELSIGSGDHNDLGTEQKARSTWQV